MPDACAVRFAPVPSGAAYFRKALHINSLHGLRASLDQYGAERNNVDLHHEDNVDPADENDGRGNENEVTGHMRAEQSHRPIRSQQPNPDQSNGQMTTRNLTTETRPDLRIGTRKSGPETAGS